MAHFLPFFRLSSLGEGGRGTNLNEHYARRSTNLIGARNSSPVTNLTANTGVVSRYKTKSKPESCQGILHFNCEQMRALTAEASAKADVRVQELLQICFGCRSYANTVTSILNIPSVL